jgi:hypothetical protein
MLELKKRLQDLFERCDIVEIADEYDEVIVDEYQNEIYFPVFGTVLFNDLDFNEYLKQSQKLISDVNSLKVKDIKFYKKLQFEINRIFHLYHKEEFSDFFTHLNENISFVSIGITNNKTSEDFKKIGHDTLKILIGCIEDKIILSPLKVENNIDIDTLVDNLIDINLFDESIDRLELKKLVLFDNTDFHFIVGRNYYKLKILIDVLQEYELWNKVIFKNVCEKYNIHNKIKRLTAHSIISSHNTFKNSNTLKELEAIENEIKKCFVFN